MGFLGGTPAPTCSMKQHCSEWARIYLKYCLCDTRDSVSLSLGLISVVSWGTAEVPQIITNFKQKSTEGLSLAFLLTWIIGDLFNLIGCMLEPATLPTQFYMAFLYTATTVILTGQTVYYSYIYHGKNIGVPSGSKEEHQDDASVKEKLLGYTSDKESKTSRDENGASHENNEYHISSSPIPVNKPAVQRYGPNDQEFYYMSARSLSRSPIPATGLWLTHSHYAHRTPPLTTDQNSSREPLIDRLQSAPPMSRTRNILSVVPLAAVFLGIYVLHLSIVGTLNKSSRGMVIQVGRKLLQDRPTNSSVQHGSGSTEIGSLLGWAMAVIYMGGRLPQICLNIKRGNVEGLSPLMFTFALLGNATYVGSILVNSMDWSKIEPNLPWLVDAGGCVLLDSFILSQFVYYNLRARKDSDSRSTTLDV
ncbi:vacuolar lysine transporter YPQ1 isoform X2 [Typha angustifolia]